MIPMKENDKISQFHTGYWLLNSKKKKSYSQIAWNRYGKNSEDFRTRILHWQKEPNGFISNILRENSKSTSLWYNMEGRET